MLILTRWVGDSIEIGDEVTVPVLGSKGDRIKLDMAAPQTVGVGRKQI